MQLVVPESFGDCASSSSGIEVSQRHWRDGEK